MQRPWLLQPWLIEGLACPAQRCGGKLAPRNGADLLDCRRCGTLYPVLDGVPVLVREPAGWMARYRESVLASLAERGAASRPTAKLVAAFADAAGAVEPMRFGDDWTAPTEEPLADPTFARWAGEAAGRSLVPTMRTLLPARISSALDLGTGDGAGAAVLASRCTRLIVGDLSLRAVLRARDRAGRRDGVGGVVMDAEALPLRAGRLDVIAAANVVDLLERPAAFLSDARRALMARGRLLLAVPDPTGLDALLADARLTIIHDVAAVPWLRIHGPRHVQVYFPRVVVARRAVR